MGCEEGSEKKVRKKEEILQKKNYQNKNQEWRENIKEKQILLPDIL